MTFPDDISHQIIHVLRLKGGDEVLVLDDLGNQFAVRLEGVEKPPVTGCVIGQEPALGEPQTRISLYFPLTRRDKLEWILQKGTEVGVASFHPFISQRSLVQDQAIKPGKKDRWLSILREAAEQSGRGRIPTLADSVAFPSALDDALTSNAGILTAWQDAPADLTKALSGLMIRLEADRSLAIFIGAEGGFTGEEMEAMHSRQVAFFTMGCRILRMETAAILAPALALMALGEMGLSE